MATESAELIRIEPQPKQLEFHASKADIAIYGGSAGAGKSYSLLTEPLRYIHMPRFQAITFRRTYPQIISEGGLWEESEEIYPLVGAEPNKGNHIWTFPSGATVRFAHMQHEKNVYDWDGAQIPLIQFDQLEQFTRRQFFYLFKANRTTLPIKPYIRAACNPDPECFLREFLDWWIDDDGYPILERAGVLRWFKMVNDEYRWYDEPVDGSRSVTFIPALLEDNPKLLEKNPEYRSALEGLPLADRLRLKEGNWNARPAAGLYFKRFWFEFIPTEPAGLVKVVRYWDRAGTEPVSTNPDPDWTVGLKMGRDAQGFDYVLDVARERVSSHGVERLIKNTASMDGPEVEIGLEQDPGQAGKMEANYLVRQLKGYRARAIPKFSDKITAAKPFSSQAEAGNVKIVRGKWNDKFLNELEYFPEGGHDDQVDAASGAFGMLQDVRQKRTVRASVY